MECVASRACRRPLSAGFSLIEAIIALAMITILMVLVAPYLSDQPGRKDVEIYAIEATDALRDAQSSVMSGRDNVRFGVHFDSVKFVLFRGSTYSPSDPTNVSHDLPGLIAIASVTLSPGGSCTVTTGAGNCDIHFASRFGTPTESGTIVFGDGTTTKTVTVGAAGLIDVN